MTDRLFDPGPVVDTAPRADPERLSPTSRRTARQPAGAPPWPPPDRSCPVCAYADEDGWWGPAHHGTHCRGCHRSWTSLAQAHCVTCHQQFVSATVADRHMSPHHVDPVDAGLYLGTDGVWSTSRDRDPAKNAARLPCVKAAMGRRGLPGGPQ